MNESLAYSVAHKMHVLAHVISVEADQALTKIHLSLTGYKFLHILNTYGSQTQVALGRRLSITPAATSKRITALKDKEFITYHINPKNRREHIISITPKGKITLKKASNILETTATKLLNHGDNLEVLDKELGVLLKPFLEQCA